MWRSITGHFPEISQKQETGIKRILTKLALLGVDDSISPYDRRFISLINMAALLGLVVDVVNLPLFLSDSATHPLALLMVFGGVLHGFVLLLNRARHYVSARILLPCALMAQIVPSAALAGLEANYHHFLLLLVIGGFFGTPNRHRGLLPVAIGIPLALYLGLLVADLAFLTLPAQTMSALGWGNLGFFIVLLVMLCIFNSGVISTYESALELQRKRSEELLLNILPEPIADRLKTTQGTIADQFDDTTILFADIVGFTKLSKKLLPMELVDLLDAVFGSFDRLTEKHGLEKIKTIGDAYMVAGGVPEERSGHCQAIAEMALEMLEVVKNNFFRENGIQLRIGIHRGPTVAGVIGRHRFIYDMWGDSVNTASHMESHGMAGRIQVTGAVRETLNDKFDLEYRGMVEIKGLGPTETWFLVGKKDPSMIQTTVVEEDELDRESETKNPLLQAPLAIPIVSTS